MGIKKSDSVSPGAGKQDEYINIKDYLFWAWEKKSWILLSVAFFLLLAGYYLYVTPKSYVRNASVMFNIDSRGRSGISELMAFSDLKGFSSVTVDILNEVEALKSPILMESVVKRLSLNVEYNKKGFLRSELLYNQSPIKVAFCGDGIPEGYSFEVKRLPGDTLHVSSFKYKGDQVEGATPVNVALNDTVPTPLGVMCFSPTRFYDSEFDYAMTVCCDFLQLSAKSFSSRLNARLVKDKTSVIGLSIADMDPNRADDIINTIIDVYSEEWIACREESRANTSNLINVRLAIIESELGGVGIGIGQSKKENMSSEYKQKAKETLYAYLLQKREENELSSSLVANNIRVLSYATGNPYPASPKTARVLVAAFIVGLFIPFGCKAVRDFIDKES